jgi:hypothetical protein
MGEMSKSEWEPGYRGGKPVSPVVVSAIFVFPSHKNNVYILSKVYCYFVWERNF